MKVLIADSSIWLDIDIRKWLEGYPEICLMGVFSIDHEVLRIARTDPPELAFIKLGDQDINGFYISRELKKINPKVKIVFIANTDYYAVEAFLEDADDYLLWPVNQERLNKCFHKIGL